MTNAARHLLRTARGRAGLTQAELARRAGVPRTVVNAYERGAREPGVAAFDRLLRAMGARVAVVAEPPVDASRAAHILEQVLDLAERLPSKRRGPLRFPPMRHLVR